MSFTSGGDYSTFSPELLDQVSERYGSFQFGNVRTDTFDDLTKNKGFLIVAGDIAQGVIKCSKECSYFRVCGGGAPANKLGEHGGFAYTQTAYCRFTKMANHDVILDLFDEHPNLVGSLANTSWWTREFR
jgi:uncharacterized protein